MQTHHKKYVQEIWRFKKKGIDFPTNIWYTNKTAVLCTEETK